MNLFELFVFLLRHWKLVWKFEILKREENVKFFNILYRGSQIKRQRDWVARARWNCSLLLRGSNPTMLLFGFVFVCPVFNSAAALCS